MVPLWGLSLNLFDDEVAEGVVGVGHGANGVGHGSFTVHVSVWRTKFGVCPRFSRTIIRYHFSYFIYILPFLYVSNEYEVSS